MKTLLLVIKELKLKKWIYFLNFIELIITYYLARIRHFIPAKLFKTRVKYFVFDVKYSHLKKKIGETEYGIDGYRWLCKNIRDDR
jgi:hypothetical protein